MLDEYKFPVGGWIILVHEVLERYAYYGTRGSMTMYLNQVLKYSETTTTIIFHVFSAFAYFVPVIGAVIADNYWGPFKTVVIIGFVYLIGHTLLPIAAVWSNAPASLVGLFVMAFGAGGIKSSVAAFGGNQIPPDKPSSMVGRYFALFYTAINVGSFVTLFITPLLAKEVACIQDRCYPLAFGVPAAVFLVTYLLFVFGYRTYRFVPTSPNVIFKFAKCVKRALVNYVKASERHKTSLLDYVSQDEYESSFLEDSKKAVRILIVFLPLPVFWALYDQQGSSWTLQAKYMDGRVGASTDFMLKPSQFMAINPLLIILLIPLFDLLIYPCLARCHLLKSPKSRLVTAYAFTAVAFVITGSLHVLIQRGRIVDYGANSSRLHLINHLQSCSLRIDNSVLETAPGTTSSLSVTPGPHNLTNCNVSTPNFTMERHRMVTIVVKRVGDVITLPVTNTSNEYGHVRLIPGPVNTNTSKVYLKKLKKHFYLGKQYSQLDAGHYEVNCGGQTSCGKIPVLPGLVVSVWIDENGDAKFLREFQPRLVHMLWQVPQNVVMSVAEILCSVTALSMAYCEAPASMKSLMQAAYLLSIFWGNIIVVLITASGGHSYSPSLLCFVYSGLVLVAGAVNWYLFTLYDGRSDPALTDNSIHNGYKNNGYDEVTKF